MDKLHRFGSAVKDFFADELHSHTHGDLCDDHLHGEFAENRYTSFVPPRDNNQVKWYVDGCGYFWAVSLALERAKESIWILDWWLSPEVYLRRPPAQNEQYRLDKMLKAAAQRGVKVNIIVYKEVTQALTRKYLSPTLPNYLESLFPTSTDAMTLALSRLGFQVIMKSLEETEKTNPLIQPPLTVSSWYTKHTLEALHPNISVFRHPDHLPDASSLSSAFSNFSLNAESISRLPGDTLKAIYGVSEDSVLFWAHHEKLCVVDDSEAFMGGLDLCYGRWDTYQHQIADVHPGDINQTIFPGQDYNNARIMDFFDVQHWENNKLDRTKESRMGWSDVSIGLTGPVVQDLKEHFVQRWNFIYKEKYRGQDNNRYSELTWKSLLKGYETPNESEVHGVEENIRYGLKKFEQKFEQKLGKIEDKLQKNIFYHSDPETNADSPSGSGLNAQLVRSCTKWSHGVPLEHSIANAYIETIRNAQHFIYIENQFFITATSEKQSPVKNRIGAAIVERVIRAAQNGEVFQIIVVIPSVPAFAGNLQADSSLGTRAIMEFQYSSICRGGHSIYEKIAQAGHNPLDYIRFYNLRNYDRINSSGVLSSTEAASGVSYTKATSDFDAQHGEGQLLPTSPGAESGAADRFQEAAQHTGDRKGLGTGKWDTVSSCYMLHGEDIRNVPWEDGNMDEIDAFVTEELYIHSKLLIADDRTVICGSANLNDRSQLGEHDSEIALVITGPLDLPTSTMGGTHFATSRFAASLRRTLFRKHLGLLAPQDYAAGAAADPNCANVASGAPTNAYDWGSAEDALVADPLAPQALDMWRGTARRNTEAFRAVFQVVPDDTVTTWVEYEGFFDRFFHVPGDPKKDKKPAGKYGVGHVVRELFPGGVAEVKEELSKIKGTLVEMPLLFLKNEDVAKEGLEFNAITAELYT